MAWFKRTKQNIETQEKKELGEGHWIKCPTCDEIMHKKQWENNYYLCTKCDHHFRIGSEEYFTLPFEDRAYKEFDKKVTSKDPLGFVDTKKYKDRIHDTIKHTGLYDAMRTAVGKINAKECIISAMDFKFIGGSMGSVVGEKINRAIQKAIKDKCPYIIISK